MTTLAETSRPLSTTRTRVGWAITGLITLFLIFDGVSHVLDPQPVKDSMAELGFTSGAALAIGVVELVLLVLYVVPRTAPLGAVLLTGYLGGAVAVQFRVESPLLSTTLFPVYVGVLLWLGLYLRDVRVRELVRSVLS
jgi:DoxX-like protein